MPVSAARQTTRQPVQRRAPRLLNAAGALSVVDPILGEAHDLPTANDRLWDALERQDLDALNNALRFRPDLELRRPVSEQDEILREQMDDPERDEFEPRREPLPLEHALGNGRLDLARRLLEAGADPNASHADGNTLLTVMVQRGLDAVNLLLEFGAEVNRFDATSASTALGQAVRRLDLAIVERLLDAGAEVNVPDPLPDSCRPPYPRHSFVAPLAVALQYLDRPGAEAIAERLLVAGARVDRVDSLEANALHRLTCHRLDWVERLVALGAHPGGSNRDGATPLHNLVGWVRQPSAQEKNAPHYMAKAQALMAHGGDLNAFDHVGRTPLLNALRNYAPLPLVRWMLEQGANPDLYMPGQHTPCARVDLLNRQDEFEESYPGYVENALQLLVEIEQRQLLAAVAEEHGGLDVPRRPRGRL